MRGAPAALCGKAAAPLGGLLCTGVFEHLHIKPLPRLCWPYPHNRPFWRRSCLFLRMQGSTPLPVVCIHVFVYNHTLAQPTTDNRIYLVHLIRSRRNESLQVLTWASTFAFVYGGILGPSR